MNSQGRDDEPPTQGAAAATTWEDNAKVISKRHLRRKIKTQQSIKVSNLKRKFEEVVTTRYNPGNKSISTIPNNVQFQNSETNTSSQQIEHTRLNTADAELSTVIIANELSTDNFNRLQNTDIYNTSIVNSNKEEFISYETPQLQFSEKLANWAVSCHIPHAHLNSLLLILREENLDVPKCSKTLLNTPRTCSTIEVAPGLYSHVGVEKGIKYLLRKNDVKSEHLPKTFELNLNVDGLPISSSTNASFWPIMACINSKISYLKVPFIIGIYQGSGKPNNVEEYLNSCVTEMQSLHNLGFEYSGKQFKVKLLNLICDAPAKAFVLSVKGHNSSHGCNKCYVEGAFGYKSISFPNLTCKLRNDNEFRLKLDEDYHKGTSPLEKLQYFDMVKNVPLDYMHLVLLGVCRKYVSLLIKGKMGTRLLAVKQEMLNNKLLKIKPCIPDNFARKPRDVYCIDRWKATEIRYAVVTFDDSSAVEAVPIIWLNDTMTKCWWPPKTKSKNVSNLIKCAAVPNSASWESHDVSLIKIYDDLSNARSKVDRVVKDLSSDECFGRGQRKVKPKTSGSDQLADIDLHQIPYVVQTSLTIPVATPLTSSTLRAAQVQHAEPLNNPPKTLSASETLIPISTISTDNDVIYEYEVTTPQAITLDDIHKCIKAGFESMLFEFTSINETMKQQTARISELENQFKNFAGPLTPSPPNTGVGDVKGLPLSDIDQIKEFENKLTEAGFYNSVCNKMKLLRGGKFDEFIRRMLAYIFTNNLAALSSWTGIRGSFEIKSLKIILAIEEPSIIHSQLFDLKSETLAQDYYIKPDGNIAIKQEFMPEKLNIKIEDVTIQESCDEYNDKNKLHEHIKLLNAVKPFNCNICNRNFGRKGNLKSHLITHTERKPFKCSICDHKCGWKRDLNRHLRTHTIEKPIKCNICDYSCKDNDSLKKHLKTHTDKKPFKCHICDYSCRENASLRRHLRTHTGEKPFKCKICDYSCGESCSLKIHLRIHTGEKPFKCNVCDYSFRLQGALKNHLRTHTGVKPFKCNICEYRVAQKGALKAHLRTHTGEKPFKCNVCNNPFSHKATLKKHMLAHSRKKPC